MVVVLAVVVLPPLPPQQGHYKGSVVSGSKVGGQGLVVTSVAVAGGGSRVSLP